MPSESASVNREVAANSEALRDPPSTTVLRSQARSISTCLVCLPDNGMGILPRHLLVEGHQPAEHVLFDGRVGDAEDRVDFAGGVPVGLEGLGPVSGFEPEGLGLQARPKVWEAQATTRQEIRASVASLGSLSAIDKLG